MSGSILAGSGEPGRKEKDEKILSILVKKLSLYLLAALVHMLLVVKIPHLAWKFFISKYYLYPCIICNRLLTFHLMYIVPAVPFFTFTCIE